MQIILYFIGSMKNSSFCFKIASDDLNSSQAALCETVTTPELVTFQMPSGHTCVIWDWIKPFATCSDPRADLLFTGAWKGTS